MLKIILPFINKYVFNEWVGFFLDVPFLLIFLKGVGKHKKQKRISHDPQLNMNLNSTSKSLP